MVRPALSASRGIDIIDVLAAEPKRALSLTEIARATGINGASCHAILAVLVERGYLARDAQARTFSLGPVLHAAGTAALIGDPLLVHARDAARTLFDDLEVPVLLSAPIGEDIVGIVAISDRRGRSTGLRVGERRPRLPPIGAPFVAWAGDEAIDRWLKPAMADPAFVAELRDATATIRDRGYQVLLLPPQPAPLASQLRELASAPGEPPPYVYHLGEMALPRTIEADVDYAVAMIAAPIFDRAGACAYNLCLGPFPETIGGRQVLDHADDLVRTCLQVMRADRANR